LQGRGSMTEIKPGTPLPWGISHGFALTDLDRAAHYVAGPDPKSVGIKIATPWIEGAWDHDDEAKANAAYIVTACNAYPSLLNGLREARDALKLASNRLARCAVEVLGSGKVNQYEWAEWADGASEMAAKLDTLLSQEGGQ